VIAAPLAEVVPLKETSVLGVDDNVSLAGTAMLTAVSSSEDVISLTALNGDLVVATTFPLSSCVIGLASYDKTYEPSHHQQWSTIDLVTTLSSPTDHLCLIVSSNLRCSNQLPDENDVFTTAEGRALTPVTRRIQGR
jgi:hypothetical protein